MTESADGSARAPRRHHFLPRLLLRAFSSPKKAELVYLYRKSKPPTPVLVKDVGVERDFYKTDKLDHIEDVLHAEEVEIANGLRELRTSYANPSPEFAAKLIVHLSIRTQNLRGSFMKIMAAAPAMISDALLTDEFIDSMHDSTLDKIKRQLRGTDGTPRGMAIRRAYGLPMAGKISRLPRHVVRRVLEAGFNAVGAPSMQRGAEMMKSMMEKTLSPELTQREHTRAVVQKIEEHKKEVSPFYAALRWKTVRAEGPLILGDMGPVSIPLDGAARPAFAVSREKLATVFLPIAPDVLLVGTKDGDASLVPEIDLNFASASASYKFFVGSDTTEPLQRLADHIGTHCDLLDEVQWSEVKRNLFQYVGKSSAVRPRS